MDSDQDKPHKEKVPRTKGGTKKKEECKLIFLV